MSMSLCYEVDVGSVDEVGSRGELYCWKLGSHLGEPLEVYVVLSIECKVHVMYLR
jgi:hypothetical protein